MSDDKDEIIIPLARPRIHFRGVGSWISLEERARILSEELKQKERMRTYEVEVKELT
jgi:hypothetical protein